MSSAVSVQAKSKTEGCPISTHPGVDAQSEQLSSISLSLRPKSRVLRPSNGRNK